jgi:Bacterial membrane protein YfhO
MKYYQQTGRLMGTTSREIRRRLAPIALLLIITGAFWKLLTKQYTWLDHPDMAYQLLPWFQFQAASWHRGEFPLWDPHVWAGQPLVGQMQPGAAYLLNWLLFLLPLKDGHIQQLWLNLYFILDHILAAMFCYWLCRDLKRSRWASVLAGAVFAMSGVVGSLGWPQMLHGAIWIPLVLLFFLRSIRGDRTIANAALSGTFAGISLLSGHHQIPTFTGLMMACLWAVHLWRRRSQAIAPLTVFFLFTALVGALQILSAQEYGRNSVRFIGTPNAIYWNQSVPYAIHQEYSHSLFPSALLGLIVPSVSPHDAFVGLAALTLALMGFAAAYRNAAVRLFGAIAAAGLLFAMGGFSLFHGVAYLTVPLVEKARTPAMALVLVQLAIAVLAAFGLDACRTRSWNRWWIPGLAMVGVLPWPVIAVLSIVRAETGLEYERLAVVGLMALALAAILYGWKRRNISSATAVGFLLLMTLFELGTVTGRNYQIRGGSGGSLTVLEQNRDIVRFLRQQPEPVRVEIDSNTVPYNIGDWEGIDQFQGYLGGITSNLLPFAAEDPSSAVVSPKLFALNFYLGKEPVRVGQEEVLRGESGVNVYRNPDAFPRYWTVHEAVRVTAAELMPHLGSIDLRREVALLEAPPHLEVCGGVDNLQVVDRGDNHIVLDAQMACRGMVILSETHFPGWEATVDGSPTSIHQAYGVLRGVVAPGGSHRITMQYRPKNVYLGALLTAAGLLGALAIPFTGLRRPSSSL